MFIFLIFTHKDLTNITKFDNRLRLIVMWLFIALSYSKEIICGKKIRLIYVSNSYY